VVHRQRPPLFAEALRAAPPISILNSRLDLVRAVGDQAAAHRMTAVRINRRQAVPARKRDDQLAMQELCVLKTRFGNSGDEGRRGRAQIRCGPRAGWRDGSGRPTARSRSQAQTTATTTSQCRVTPERNLSRIARRAAWRVGDLLFAQ